MDLLACSSEPVHIPGSIQPHGILLVVECESDHVVAAAGEVALMFNFEGDPIGRTFESLVGSPLSSFIEATGFRIGQEPVLLGTLAGTDPDKLDILAHEREGRIIVEIEPSLQDRSSALGLFARMRASVATIKETDTTDAACHAATEAIRALTGYDRVVAYRFLDDGSGRVIAEAGGETLGSLLNQHFPESDIPAQAMALYRRNLIRVIPDVAYVPVPLGPESAQRLDMSDCALRSVSPIHIRYLKNMGVAASMSVSVMLREALWGLIACHSGRPTAVPYETREACKHVAGALAQRIETIEGRQRLQETEQLASRRERLLAQLVGSRSAEAEIMRCLPEIMALVPASAVIARHRGTFATHGMTPSAAESLALCVWAVEQAGTAPYSTNVLAEVFAPAGGYSEQASGLLAISVGDEDPVDVLWLRPEYAETIEWAGHPHKGVDASAAAAPLSPRASFAIWRELIRGRAQPWSQGEVDAARRLRGGIDHILQRQKVDRLQAAVVHMSRANAMGTMASAIAHEINQPLASVQNYASGLTRMLQRQSDPDPEVASILDRISEGALRAGDIVRRLRRLVARGSVALEPVSLLELVENACSIALLDAPRMSVTTHIDVPADLTVLADGVQIQQVIMNLVRNAVEAMEAREDGKERSLAITASRIPDRCVQLTVKDSGPGLGAEIRDLLFSAFNTSKDGGLGIGLSICRTIVEAHGGKIWADEPPGGGAAFSFTLREA